MRSKPGRVLGVLGGLGPMASVYFYEMVTAHTRVEVDQDHIDIVISSRATTPDRTAFITGASEDDPFVVMEAEARRLVEFGAQVMAIPCNTAHYFYARLNEVLPIPVLNMIVLTVEKAQQLGCGKMGVLATDGTIQSQGYQMACGGKGMAYAVPGADAQKGIMQLIYDIKAGKAPQMQLFEAAAQQLRAQGCDCLVLGCTELSLLKKMDLLAGAQDVLDSMEVLADAAVKACGKESIGFMWG